MTRAGELAAAHGGSVTVTNDPLEAAAGADVLYTDVWASMGQEGEAAGRLESFRPYAIDDRIVAAAAADVVVMHCLPAHRGEEIAADGHRRPGEHRVRPGREPAARAEGAAGVPARRRPGSESG